MADEDSVFISHATDTKPLARKLVRGLEQEGIHTWTDFKDLKPGQRLVDEVEYALDKANWYLILVSPHSYATPGEEAEWRVVLAKAWSNSDKKLVPVLVGGSDPLRSFDNGYLFESTPRRRPRIGHLKYCKCFVRRVSRSSSVSQLATGKSVRSG